MAEKRKLQSEIEKTLKKVDEGVEEFDEIWEKVKQTEAGTNLRDKMEADLKKEIKKLQRYRDQIKTWSHQADIIDKTGLTEARKRIESKMEQFKQCERTFKMKAFSKEGLARGRELDPQEKEREVHRIWLTDLIQRVQTNIEQYEAEIDAAKASKKGKKDKGAGVSADTQEHLEHHKWHLIKLEQLLRRVDNAVIEPSQLEDSGVKESVEWYLDSHKESGTDAFDDTLYEEFALEEEPTSTLLGGGEKEREGAGEEDPSAAAAAAGEEGKDGTKRAAAAAPKAAPVINPGIPTLHKPGSREKTTPSGGPSGTLPHASLSASSRERDSREDLGAAASAVRQESASGGGERDKPEDLSAAGATGSGSVGGDRVSPSSASASGGVERTATGPEGGAGNAPASAAPNGAVEGGAASTAAASPSGGAQPQPSAWLHGPPPVAAAASAEDGAEPESSPGQNSQGPVAVASTGIALGGSTASASAGGAPRLDQSKESESAKKATGTPATSTPSGSAPPPGIPAGGSSSSTPQPPQSSPSGSQTGGGTEKGKENFVAALPSAPQIEPTNPAVPPGDAASNGRGTGVSQSAWEAMCRSFQQMQTPADTQKAKVYNPRNPYPYPGNLPYPKMPLHNLARDGSSEAAQAAMFSKYELDTLFFIFYYQQGTRQQYLASQELKAKSWRFHKKYFTWFQRHEEPKVAEEDHEQGNYVYFDFEQGWTTRIKNNFKFEYAHLAEDV
uniref:NOT2/NOT3/NOT5 C-terminal domain-containing protein n=1 Tax=Chromera velia CCMP2878 TaxID=1169474 RepID=A0A0G4I9U2_9ALVE|mmetsp:Transcript_17328/g.35179  ORF Transcript_17328/g.35179 Transcript_17328/m.35179 type:complete len:730 (-) Transcript_17328:353-2542(-)|eukprot:Cvel_12377.t1-p1 / transcript=Cvel_12377.t1 / gene=Cvel_12377 / organism=Chromera_velia_CCMP2878 / gene_product=CCR4-NOT transcription complex subunit 3, putative / transcript_product=CCR4-NOT transcription complex subunit 3, putative / location=Cvel_scaffold808:25851-35536(-) / protein_length=729 / sequence_SO=supercontig / SO=protein_coding / is_pseudo=false